MNELIELFNQARDKIEEKVKSVQNASTKVQDLKSMAGLLVRNVERKLERIIGKNDRVYSTLQILRSP